MVRRLSAGGDWIRTFSSGMPPTARAPSFGVGQGHSSITEIIADCHEVEPSARRGLWLSMDRRGRAAPKSQVRNPGVPVKLP